MPDFDTRFSLPAVDDPASTETGVILMGLDAERLLTGLGLAVLADDPAYVALAVDHLRHGVAPHPSMAAVLAEGSRRWQSVRAAMDAAGARTRTSGSPRQAWEHARRAVDAIGTGHGPRTGGLGETGPATRAYLAACWLRRHEVDRCAARVVEGTVSCAT